jgi:adenosylhomocysteinase
MRQLAARVIDADLTPLAIVEIGGYFAPVANSLQEEFGQRFAGCVEDSENGHRAYEKAEPLSCSVVSVARSRIKLIEDRLIGPSVIFSVESRIRSMGQPMTGLTIGVIGYGRVGAGIARSAASRGNHVLVYDSSPRERALAIADGFRCPDRDVFLERANIIIGATGEESLHADDFSKLRQDVILGSASSKNIEFALPWLNDNAASRIEIGSRVQYGLPGGKRIQLLDFGAPVNFQDGAVVGSSLNLVQGEILYAIQTLLEQQGNTGISVTPPDRQDALLERWIDHFVDRTESGTFIPLLDVHATH